MKPRDLPLWRSILYVPVLNDKFVVGAPRHGADAIQLDLEDSIPDPLKPAARRRVAEAAAEIAAAGIDVTVRINRPWRSAFADLEAAIGPDVCALSLPKVPHAQHIRSLAEILDELEAERGLTPGHTKLIAMVETPEGLLDMPAIAAADDRVIGLVIGAEDLAATMGMEPDADALYIPNVQAVASARAAGCLPLGFVGTVADFADEEAFRAVAWRARRLGFMGATCIHPKQVPILNAAFSPSAGELGDAEELLAAYDAAVAAGRGAITHKGRMVDAPVVARARAVLQRHAAIVARKGRY
jgi:citrate lyase subunit beta/citryl-CoA lyase